MKRVDRASRVIAAPPDRVYAALTERESLSEWLAPKGMTARFEHFDARPGGSYRLVLTYDDDQTEGKASDNADVVEARFVELVPGQRVTQAIDFESDDPAFTGTMTMRWRLDEVGSGTRVEITAEDVPGGISAEDHAAGMESSLANLAALLERAPRRTSAD